MKDDDRYSTQITTGGERSVILEGFIVQVVFVGPTHADLAQRVVKFLNEDERERAKKEEAA